ncbi:HD-GYP domain-containing protein [Paenibacillus sp. GCM10023252]|uniref:HD-GYP domain-containing protein n=1 Tax=Paenibacillus sp. GCM10023252 TaxID=3252649 RepID=UPI0036212DFF
MRLISINHYDQNTMQLAKPVYDSRRRILLAEGTTIHPKYLERLRAIHISHLIVEDKESEGITLEEMLDMPTWLNIMSIVKQCFDAIRLQQPIPLRSVLQCIGQLLGELRTRPILLPIPSTVIGQEMRIYAHAVNVCLMSLQVGKHLGYTELQLRDLALGCILHDIGKAAELDDPAKHPEKGFEIMRSVWEISIVSAHVAFQHHETIDGRGYPRGIQGDQVHRYAQICALCNLYDHLITDEGVQPHEAIEVIMGQNGMTYSEAIVHAFLKAIPPYPPGTKIQLSDGQDAIVTRIRTPLQRPDIRYLESLEELSLSEHPTVMIVSAK